MKKLVIAFLLAVVSALAQSKTTYWKLDANGNIVPKNSSRNVSVDTTLSTDKATPSRHATKTTYYTKGGKVCALPSIADGGAETCTGGTGSLPANCSDVGGNLSCTGPISAPGFSAPVGTALAGYGAEMSLATAAALFAGLPGVYLDSTAHLAQSLVAAGTLGGTMVVPAASPTANQFVDNIGTNGVQSKRVIAAADVPATPLPTPGTSVSLTGATRGYCIISGGAGTCTPPTPAAGYEYCARNGNNQTNVITLAAVTNVFYEKTDRSGYGTVSYKLVSGGAATDQICIVGLDSTHYLVMSSTGTWTDTAP